MEEKQGTRPFEISKKNVNTEETEHASESSQEPIIIEVESSLALNEGSLHGNPPSSKIQQTNLREVVDFENLSKLKEEYQELRRAYEDKRQDLKLADREKHDQSLELRDLKQQNAELRDLLRARSEPASDQEKLAKGEKTKYLEHFEILEDHIARLERERKRREAHVEFLTAQTREANEGKSMLETDTRKLQGQIRDLSTDLTECKDDLLRLQPQSQISDNEISEQYYNIAQQIAGWIDNQTEDPQILEERFDRLKTTDDLPEVLKSYITNEHLRLARRHRESQPLLLEYLIHCYLQCSILSGDIYLFGLDARKAALLQGMEQAMKLLEPRRDIVTIRRWRSEALRGLLKMDDFAAEQDRQAMAVSQKLKFMLLHLVPEYTQEDDWKGLHEQIVVPTIQLATSMRLSTNDYNVSSQLFARSPGQDVVAYHQEVRNANMIDIATHKAIRPNSKLKIAEDGRIGIEMLVVSPALLRVQSVGHGKIMICKPTVLVKLDEPMVKKNRGIRALGAWTPSLFGLDSAADS